jgi:iron complex outermembrane recepter protein
MTTRNGGPVAAAWTGLRLASAAQWVIAGLLLGGSEAHAQAGGAPSPAAPSAGVPSTGRSAAPPPSQAQDDDADEAPAPNTSREVVVTGRKPPPQPGAVVGDIKPEEQFSPADIRSFGDSTVTELINDLAPEARSDRGRGGDSPVILLNGRRISSFNEVQNIPTEAILRVDILPEEVALKYGYTADQKVINIVLRRRFHAITGEALGGGPTEGGQVTGQAEADLLRLRGDSRLNLDLKYTGQSNLTEADRGLDSTATELPFDTTGNVVSPTSGGEIDPQLSALVGHPVTVAGVPAGLTGAPTLAQFAQTAGVANQTYVGADRTLLPATQQITANAVMSQPIFWGIRATGNLTLGASTSDALQGLPGLTLAVPAGDPFSPFGQTVDVDRYASGLGPLRQSVEGWTAHFGSTLNKDLGDWRLSLTDAYDHADTDTRTDAGADSTPLQALLDSGSNSFNPFAGFPAGLVGALAQNTAASRSDAANIQFLANGPLFQLPAGPFYASFKVGDTESLQNSRSQIDGVLSAADLSRNDANVQVNLDLPLASREKHVFGWVGDLSLNANAAVDDLSDFGVLQTIGYGVNWTPIDGVNLIVSHTDDQAAPTLAQLAAPVITTPGTRLFDYATGQTVDVTQITGGNADLSADHRSVTKVGLTWKPLEKENLTVIANYIVSRIRDPIATFPAADAQLELAFPDRFVRNADGVLTEEDDRAVNFDSSDREELRWGFNYSHALGPQPQPRWRRPGGYRQRDRGDPTQSGGASGGAGGATTDGAPPAGDAQSGSAEGDRRSGGAAPAAGSADAGGGQSGGARGDGGGGPRGGGFGGSGRGGYGGRGGGLGGGRMQFALYHTVYFVDRETIRTGVPALDFLNGAAMGETGGQYQHEIEAQAGFVVFGVGARLSADWRSATTVVGDVASGSDLLRFSSIGTVNFRLFDYLGQQPWVVQRFPLARGGRVTLSVTNLFDTRIQVRDASGQTPLIYQPAYLDPAGRTVTLSLRKLFY